MLKMIHPDIDSIANTTVEAYNAVWAPRGWVLLEPAEAYASEILGKPVKKVDDLLVDELKGLIAARGLDYPQGQHLKADLTKTYRGSFAGDAPVDGAGEPVEVAPAASPEDAAALAAAEASDATPATATTTTKK